MNGQRLGGGMIRRGLCDVVAAVILLGIAAAANATLLVPNSTYGFLLTHRNSSGNVQEETAFRVLTGSSSSTYYPGQFGYSDMFFFSEEEEDLGQGRYTLTFRLNTDGDLFPDYGDDDYGTGFAVGALDPVDLTTAVRLTAARITYTDQYGDEVASASVLDQTVAGAEPIWNGQFPGPNGTIGFTNVFDRSVTLLTLRLSAEEVAPVIAQVPEPATWTSLLVGFAAVGIALRRRRRVTTAALG